LFKGRSWAQKLASSAAKLVTTMAHCASRNSTYRSWVLYALSLLCTTLVAGLAYGWPTLRQQLQDDGSNLSEKTLGAIFTVGAWSTQCSRFFTGLARDRFGIQRTLTVCMMLVTLGILGIGWSDPNDAMTLGVSMLALGCGSGVQLCVQPVAGLFPQNTGLVLTTLSGGFQLSGLVFLALTSWEVQRQASFSGFAVCLLMLTAVAIVLFPKGKSFILEDSILTADDEKASSAMDETELATVALEFSMREEDTAFDRDLDLDPDPDPESQLEKKAQENCDAQFGSEEQLKREHIMKNGAGEEQELIKDIKDETTAVENDEVASVSATLESSPTAMEQLKSMEYIMLCAWISICLISFLYYIGSIGFQLEEKGDDGFHTGLFSIIYAGTTVLAPIGGYLVDHVGLGITQGLATLMLAMSLFVLVSDSLDLQVGGMILCSIGILFIFGMFFSNIGMRFGYANYGTLAGLGLLISGAVSLLQYPLVALAVDGKAAGVNIGLAVALLALFPYFIWLHQREKAREIHPLHVVKTAKN
jgi:LAT3 family solute carrier family 43 protein 3